MAGAGKATMKGRVDPLAYIARFEPKLLQNFAERGAEIAKDSLDYPGPQAPSDPGEAPNSQTGLLHEGIESEVFEEQHFSRVVSHRIGDDENIPVYLEEGTPTMAARPYMSPAYEQTRHEADDIIRKTKEEI